MNKIYWDIVKKEKAFSTQQHYLYNILAILAKNYKMNKDFYCRKKKWEYT